MPKYHIGDVVIRPVGLENPYKYDGPALMGTLRVKLLTDLANNRLSPEWVAWYAPAFGGARTITRDEVNWETSSIRPGT